MNNEQYPKRSIKQIEQAVGSDTFCVLPWIHLSTRPSGKIRTCCTSNASAVSAKTDPNSAGEVGIVKTEDGKPSNLNTSDFLTAWNSTYMKNTRQKMMSGEQPESCKKCYKEEQAGHRSKRHWETEYWAQQENIEELVANTATDGSVAPNLTYIDLRMGTKCNLKCVMCSPHDSSEWIPDWKKMYPNIKNANLKESMQWDKSREHGASYNWHKNNPVFWQQLYDQIPHMKQLYFAGGEATIIEEHYTLLEKVVEMGYAENIELRYNSNGIAMPERLFALWKNFKRVRFHFSIDSIGDMNHYIRYPSNWEHIKQQFDLLDQTDDNVEVTIACAVQALNVYYLPDFIRWKLNQNYKKINMWPLGAGLINYHFVYFPAHLNVKVLPDWFKYKIMKKYQAFYPWLEEQWQKTGAPNQQTFIDAQYGIKRLQGIVQFMMSEDWSQRMPEFKEYIEHMDQIRGTDFAATFPEMKRLIL